MSVKLVTGPEATSREALLTSQTPLQTRLLLQKLFSSPLCAMQHRQDLAGDTINLLLSYFAQAPPYCTSDLLDHAVSFDRILCSVRQASPKQMCFLLSIDSQWGGARYNVLP